jgi:glycosyltransferase involved in cell wall biosynthesis
MGRAVISGDGPAVRQAFCDGEQIVLCARGDGHALAEAIHRLQQDSTLRQRVAEQGHAAFMAHYTVEKLGERFRGHIEELLTS